MQVYALQEDCSLKKYFYNFARTEKYLDMPTISMFFGIIIRMYYAPKEHNPPHFHVYYQDFRAKFDIATCAIIDGELPKRQLRLVEAWAEIHKEDLFANWSLCQAGEKPFNIDPLK